jgi:TIGR03009 family protein
MMRLTWTTTAAILVVWAHISAPSPGWSQQQAAPPQVRSSAVQATPAARIARQVPATPPQQPFPPLAEAELAQLQALLQNWQVQSQGTKTLESKFTRWHFDMFAAPAGVHATRADGVLKYAAPDKGLFRVDRLVFFAGMQEDKPQYQEQPGQHGEHWVCNGTQLIEFDRGNEECRIQDLPAEMQGQQILNSPLPFVFNLDAQQIQQRYWVRQVQAPKPGIVLVEAWPKRQDDRAQYKLVQIALDDKTYMPQALIMYAPNFDPKKSPKWDHYEFTEVKRNAIGAGFQKFLGNFIAEKPPATWKILRDKFVAPLETDDPQTAAAPANIR